MTHDLTLTVLMLRRRLDRGLAAQAGAVHQGEGSHQKSKVADKSWWRSGQNQLRKYLLLPKALENLYGFYFSAHSVYLISTYLLDWINNTHLNCDVIKHKYHYAFFASKLEKFVSFAEVFTVHSSRGSIFSEYIRISSIPMKLRWETKVFKKVVLYCLHLPQETSPENTRAVDIAIWPSWLPLLYDNELYDTESIPASTERGHDDLHDLLLATTRVWSGTGDTCQCFILYVYNAM